jgi:hypothetical protein
MKRITEVLWLLGDVKRDLENLEEELRRDGREFLAAGIGRKLERAMGTVKGEPKRSSMGAIRQRRSKYF